MVVLCWTSCDGVKSMKMERTWNYRGEEMGNYKFSVFRGMKVRDNKSRASLKMLRFKKSGWMLKKLIKLHQSINHSKSVSTVNLLLTPHPAYFTLWNFAPLRSIRHNPKNRTTLSHTTIPSYVFKNYSVIHFKW